MMHCSSHTAATVAAAVTEVVFKAVVVVTAAATAIHRIPIWRPINYSSVCILISPLRLVNVYKKQNNFEVKMRRRGLINMQTKE